MPALRAVASHLWREPGSAPAAVTPVGRQAIKSVQSGHKALLATQDQVRNEAGDLQVNLREQFCLGRSKGIGES